MKKAKLTHVDKSGRVKMVDVGDKPVVRRTATASAALHCSASTIRLLRRDALPKGDVLATARLAGIQAAKQTASLIPLCHVLPLHAVEVDLAVTTSSVKITATVATDARTGVEMEALTAASVAALTLYDMMKAVDKTMVIDGIRLVEKTKSPCASDA